MGLVFTIDGATDFIYRHNQFSQKKEKDYSPFLNKVLGLVSNEDSAHTIELTEDPSAKIISIEALSGNDSINVEFCENGNSAKLDIGDGLNSIRFTIHTKKPTPLTYIRFRTETICNGKEQILDFDLIVIVCVEKEAADKIREMNLLQCSELQNLSVSIAIKEDKREYPAPNSNVRFIKDGNLYNNNYGYGYGYNNSQQKIGTADRITYKYNDGSATLKNILMLGEKDCICQFVYNCRRQAQYTDTQQKMKSQFMTINENPFEITVYIANRTDFDVNEFSKNILQTRSLILSSLSNGNTSVGLSVLWQRCLDAVSYSIELYRYVGGIVNLGNNPRAGQPNQFVSGTIQYDVNSKKLVYVWNNQGYSLSDILFMLKKSVDREQCYFSLSNIPRGAYFVRVFAEDRQGDIIMKSALTEITI